MDNKEMLEELYKALVGSVELEMDEFADNLEDASRALKGVRDAARGLVDVLEARPPVQCIDSIRSMKETYWEDGKINRVKFFDDVALMILNFHSLLNMFTQYTRNNALLLAMGGTQISFSIKGNPLLPDISMEGFGGKEIG